jgi:hypothetical protein
VEAKELSSDLAPSARSSLPHRGDCKGNRVLPVLKVQCVLDDG